jgi:hypothetical protein
MKFYFHPEASAELEAAVEYYDNCQPGLGFEFVQEVYSAIMRIVEYPDAWTPISGHTRRCLTNRFPFGVIYQIKSDVLYIVAVANLRQRPDYWKERSKHIK